MSSTDWSARAAELANADGEEWDRLYDLLEADWYAAYRAEFARFAHSRGWTQENVDSGWLDEMPKQARWNYGLDADPAACAREDVAECEMEGEE